MVHFDKASTSIFGFLSHAWLWPKFIDEFLNMYKSACMQLKMLLEKLSCHLFCAWYTDTEFAKGSSRLNWTFWPCAHVHFIDSIWKLNLRWLVPWVVEFQNVQQQKDEILLLILHVTEFINLLILKNPFGYYNILMPHGSMQYLFFNKRNKIYLLITLIWVLSCKLE